MAINSGDKQCDKISTKYSFTSSRGNTLPSCHLLKLSVTTDGSITSSDSKSSKAKRGRNGKSPYLTGDSVQLLSRVTEKKLYAQHKRGSDFVSSFPLAANIYRANSDEFKTQKRVSKKVKKSVLTLPNAPSEPPQTCTVSDTNDSKYVDKLDDNRNLKPNKRLSANNRKSRVRKAGYEFYDRDARYCSQMNIHLDSSTDTINNFTGDGKRINKSLSRKEAPSEQELNAHDVWAVLRNINRFQFTPSPPMSVDSIQTTRKKKTRNKRKNNRKDTRVIETCRTEEFAYISSYEVDSKSPLSFSQSSSFDRITVIDKQNEFSEICKEFQKGIATLKNVNGKNHLRESIIPKIRNQNRKNTKNNIKSIMQKESNEQTGPQRIQREQTKSPDFQSVNKHIENPETLVGTYNNLSPRKKNAAIANKNVAFLNGTVSQAKESTGTLHSGSSKAAVDIPTNCRRDYSDNLLNASTSESGHQVEGITKVILSKGQNLMLPKRLNEMQNRKTRLDTTLPRAPITPKLTQTEIRRKLANLKFPIVILGKDQLCSTSVQVMNYEYPHLQGLNQPIWPFMKDWYSTSANKKENDSGKQKKTDGKPDEFNISKYKNQYAERNKNTRKQNEATANKPDRHINEALTANKKKNLKRPLPPNEIVKIKPQTPKKPKPINQLKDKMLKLLYKNTSAKEIDEQYKNSGPESSSSYVRCVDIKPAKVDVGTETVLNYEAMSQTLSKSINAHPQPIVKKNLTIPKQPWGKAKWASDFIETVIKKIRCGVYYNHDNKLPRTVSESKEASIQTVLSGSNFKLTEQTSREEAEVTIAADVANKAEVINETEVQNRSINDGLPDVIQCVPNNYLKALPGFDECLPALEIKTLNTKEVAVKHCMTNVMVQFDISVPSETEPMSSLQKSSSFVPLTVTESQTKIFKCKTTIINAMLPAEICSLLPKIMRTIIESNKPLPSIPSTVPYQTDGLLYTISELSNSESQDIFNPVLPSKVNLSSTLLNLTNGVFSSNKTKPRTCNLPALIVNDWNKVTNVFVELPTLRLFPRDISPIYLGLHKPGKKRTEKNQNLNGFNSKTCTDLELYRGTPLNIIFGRCYSRMIENATNRNTNIQIKLFTNNIPLMLTLTDHNIIMSMTNNTNGFEEKASVMIDNMNLNSYFPKNVPNKTSLNAIEDNSHQNNSDNQAVQTQNTPSLLRTRKNKFVRLYKKCKSTSNISSEKCCTSLSKITNLEDFLQAVGSGKLLSSVFDGFSGKKILSSLLEMKSWITEISQRQAMLVLLLNNKKDTPNLVRFRPVLLQGIAVNRITRASELDMEIEVIETENFNKFSKYEGIPCISETVENRNILMEEMYWIAKTTASDYQKPFNEASEKLLKSLLEKRKKLNPSYLRVMARYVGLGLLKSSTKN